MRQTVDDFRVKTAPAIPTANHSLLATDTIKGLRERGKSVSEIVKLTFRGQIPSDDNLPLTSFEGSPTGHARALAVIKIYRQKVCEILGVSDDE